LVFFYFISETLRTFLRHLNEYHPDIRFTNEIEENQSISFLDLRIHRNEGKIEYDIFRKPTTTKRVITNNSLHAPQHKMSVFHSLIHRLYTVPLNQERFQSEKEYILSVADMNGYKRQHIEHLMNRKQWKLKKQSCTTFAEQNQQKTNGILALTFHPIYNNNIRKVLMDNNIKVVNKPNTRLGEFLGSTKDKINDLEKSGIYKVTCNDCDKFYIGQTIFSCMKRYKQHASKFKHKHYDQSAVALHMYENGHNIDDNNVHLVQHVSNRRLLDITETIHIHTADEELLMNREPGPLHLSRLIKHTRL